MNYLRLRKHNRRQFKEVEKVDRKNIIFRLFEVYDRAGKGKRNSEYDAKGEREAIYYNKWSARPYWKNNINTNIKKTRIPGTGAT